VLQRQALACCHSYQKGAVFLLCGLIYVPGEQE